MYTPPLSIKVFDQRLFYEGLIGTHVLPSIRNCKINAKVKLQSEFNYKLHMLKTAKKSRYLFKKNYQYSYHHYISVRNVCKYITNSVRTGVIDTEVEIDRADHLINSSSSHTTITMEEVYNYILLGKYWQIWQFIVIHTPTVEHFIFLAVIFKSIC